MKKPLESQRKEPKQSRSRAVVDAIFEATVRILPKIGAENLTTKKIADLAGISIGSLYQYFPNKESVLVAVMEIGIKANLAEFEKKVAEIDGRSMQESTGTMVDFALELFLKEKEKIREIYRQAPALGQLPVLMKVRQIAVERLAIEMAKHLPGRTQDEYVRVSFIAMNSLMGVIHTMLYDETQSYTTSQLAEEMKSMLNAYFQDRVLAHAPN